MARLKQKSLGAQAPGSHLNKWVLAAAEMKQVQCPLGLTGA